jgi:hypothetical protein
MGNSCTCIPCIFLPSTCTVPCIGLGIAIQEMPWQGKGPKSDPVLPVTPTLATFWHGRRGGQTEEVRSEDELWAQARRPTTGQTGSDVTWSWGRARSSHIGPTGPGSRTNQYENRRLFVSQLAMAHSGSQGTNRRPLLPRPNPRPPKAPVFLPQPNRSASAAVSKP